MTKRRTPKKGTRSPDAVCKRFARHARRQLRLKLKKLDRDTVLIEGQSRGLEFLGELLIAQSRFHDCGFQMSPKGAGSRFFNPKSQFGLYIHRLPCRLGRL